ncbi:MAG: bifunctional diaminohydroxyphosphoribosylaminopyrimidine deaminase/5-amino-6-(5-phosphoribosylamino)uracil reductase RibD [Alphaproteobacteria bacterium]|nr:bifunctional diaminohydroxyphosphoribosylaminopyrimidine deaminase/5-amino-6-(5-phosphoribosylamino)uracil reductase RibD [Alphaproteobacteria bacterium]MBL6776806.1 bifunctional diaminohydroxyphosphoribosylaminopyrimidine deaminase/5-amino-6-(5-phosphoribosylamino)uracil reductase RibD [Alphaproteobacteria bacterium]
MTSDLKLPNPISPTSDDKRWMRLALLMAARAQGRTAENPPVGCALVSKDGQLLATGMTGRGGRPHAEQSALDKCKNFPERLIGASAYVTLEPCAHHGQTPPCAEALLAAGIGRVVYSIGDPDSRVDGRGHAILEQAGISVEAGLLQDKSHDIMAGFLTSQSQRRPAFTSKTALSADGFIAKQHGQQTWLTGASAKTFVHDLRSRHDGILTGIDTILSDNPQLNCRLAGDGGDSPVRLVMDSRLQLPLACNLVQTAKKVNVLVFTRPDCDTAHRQALETAGVQVILCEHIKGGRPHPEFVADFCWQMGIYSILLEAGARLNKAFFEAGLVDKIVEIIAPKILQSGYAGYSPSQISQPSMAFAAGADYIKSSAQTLAEDKLIIWHRKDIYPSGA